MSTADLGKLALGGPAGPHEEALAKLLNELYRTPPAGLGAYPSFAGPSLGGAGVSPGAVTTAFPAAGVLEPSPASAALPAAAPQDATYQVAQQRGPALTPAGPSAGGAGVSPGAATTVMPKAEPSSSEIALPDGSGLPAQAPVGGAPSDLDQLASLALLDAGYAGPSLSGIGASPGIATTASAPKPGIAGIPSDGPGSEPLAQPPAPSVPPLGLEVPGDTELKALLAPLSLASLALAPSAGPGAPLATGGPADLHFLKSPSRVPGSAASGQAPATERVGSSGADAPAFQSAHPAFDVHHIRRDFPILSETVNGRQLIWLDNAATTQKPSAVIERLKCFYEHENSNIHRAAHELAARSTDAYEGARATIARFLNASSTEEIVFVRGATEAINLVAKTWGAQNLTEGDEIVLTHLEHHANIVPWQQIALEKGARIRVAPVDDTGQVLLEEYGKLLGPKTRLVAFPQVSNALGTVTPAKEMVAMARRVGAVVLVDGAQGIPHMKTDVQDLGADFYVFSGHKIFGPTGIGVLWGRKELLDSLPPWQGGGNMIRDVTFERTEFHAAPLRFEAGTGNIADAVGLGTAIDYVDRVGMENIARYEHSLVVYATKLLSSIPGLRIIGTAPEKASVVSFVIKGIPSEEIGAKLNTYGIAVRAGHHCAQPILRRFGLEATVRPSFAFYNTCAEADALAAAIERIRSEHGRAVA